MKKIILSLSTVCLMCGCGRNGDAEKIRELSAKVDVLQHQFLQLTKLDSSSADTTLIIESNQTNLLAMVKQLQEEQTTTKSNLTFITMRYLMIETGLSERLGYDGLRYLPNWSNLAVYSKPKNP